MVFSSSIFLFAFFPVVLIGYFIVPSRALKNTFLLIASLLFYAWGEPVYILLMLASIFCNWLLALLIEDKKFDEHRKLLLVVSVIFNIAVIGFFKYEGFLANIVNGMLGFTLIPNLELPLPIGISFYTLQALSYVIDVYRREVPAQRNVLYLGMYISFFPQLIAGPIVRYQTIADQIRNRKESFFDVCVGMRLFIVGLAKKVLLANVMAILATDMLSSGGENIGAIGAWLGLIAYTFQIFFDFSGYSDMAIGLGRMFGFSYLRNFNYPYISKSITEFWRRWHISLSTFFRDYLYIPLGGNRVSQKRWVFNILCVWTVTGLWHGAAWNYILWGAFYGGILLCEKLLWGGVLSKLPSMLQHSYTILIFMLGWLLFWIEDTQALTSYASALIGSYGATGTSTFWQLGAWEYWPVLCACIVASTPLVPFLRAWLAKWGRGEKGRPDHVDIVDMKHLSTNTLCTFDIVNTLPKRQAVLNAISFAIDALLILLLVLSAISIVSGSFNPFIYFKF
ncbi:MBOAT family O-acyltransferase [Arabiibacter massiliensis]|uniref:MBOAT family O-acyltransferase n=1 Tax=Arabiibacter massiliensis TaxID=1870985 RepID=UPI0009B950AF|nr:MBOAT family O-acyltransferase [Arabiibacter massiliensis]